ncbi:MAG: Na/Pi symporter, partial [Christensenellales bacterium]
FSNPLIGILAGALFTAVMQSSSAAIGILQAFAGLGLIGLNSSAYVLLGMNIGTCITAILAAIGTSQNSKRAAGIHLMFNIVGTLVFIGAMAIIPDIVGFVKSLSPDSPKSQIANFHLLFNVSVAVLLFPFAPLMVKLIKRIIPDKHSADEVEKRLIFLDARIIQTPAIVLGQTLKELKRLGDISADNMRRATTAFFDRNESKARKVLDVEETIDYLTHHITDYLIEFRGMEISGHDLKILGSLHHVVIDMERIGDLAENIAEFSISITERKSKFSEEADGELRTMTSKALETLQRSLEAFAKRDKSLLAEVDKLEQEVDDMKKQYIDNHIERLQSKFCDPQVGVVFTNMVSTLERVADHALNIAYSIAGD